MTAGKKVGCLFAVVLGLLFFVGFTGFSFIAEAAMDLLLGWVLFLGDAADRVAVNWPGVAGGVLAGAAFCGGSHLFFRWLWKQTGAGGERAWPWRWTVSVTLLLVFMFVASIATLGLVHQVGWLARDDGKFVVSTWGNYRKLRMAENVCRAVEANGVEAARETVAAEMRLIILQRRNAAGDVETLLVDRDPMARFGGGVSLCKGREAETVPDALVAETLGEFVAASSSVEEAVAAP